MANKGRHFYIHYEALLTSRQFSESEVLHGTCGDQRLLRVVQHMGQCVHTDVIVGNVHTHGLFSHSRLVCVTRRLLIIGDS